MWKKRPREIVETILNARSAEALRVFGASFASEQRFDRLRRERSFYDKFVQVSLNWARRRTLVVCPLKCKTGGAVGVTELSREVRLLWHEGRVSLDLPNDEVYCLVEAMFEQSLVMSTMKYKAALRRLQAEGIEVAWSKYDRDRERDRFAKEQRRQDDLPEREG